MVIVSFLVLKANFGFVFLARNLRAQGLMRCRGHLACEEPNGGPRVQQRLLHTHAALMRGLGLVIYNPGQEGAAGWAPAARCRWRSRLLQNRSSRSRQRGSWIAGGNLLVRQCGCEICTLFDVGAKPDPSAI